MYNALLVDDEPVIVENLIKTVPWKEFGFDKVGTAKDGNEALEWMAQHECHLLVTDIRMPKMDGLELLKIAHERYPDMHSIILSAYDEFEYAREALRLGADNYLLKPINLAEMIDTIKDVTTELYTPNEQKKEKQQSGDAFRENVLSGWISGRLQGAELAERAEVAGINIFSRTYYVLCFKEAEGKNKLYPFVQKIEEDLSSVCDCYRFTNVNGVHVLTLGGRTVDVHGVRKRIQRLIEGNEDRVVLFGAVGPKASGSAEVPMSYRSASDLLNFNMLFPKNTILFSDDFSHAMQNIREVDCDAFVELLHEEQDKDILFATQDMAERILSHAKDSADITKALIIDVLVNIVQEAQKYLPLDKELPVSMTSLFERLDRITGKDDLVKWLCEVMSDTRRIIKEEWNRTNPVVRRVLTKITNCYNEPLSIKTISAEIGINPSYLGYLFKQETGQYFSDYLNGIRLQEAQKLLIHTEYSIRDIAEKTGYSNASYFSKIFQNQCGMSPVKYRHTNKKEISFS
jgi:two-component system response regulator YesN